MKNLSRIENQVDEEEEEDLREKYARLQEEGEETKGGFHQPTPHKETIGHRENDAVDKGISPKQD